MRRTILALLVILCAQQDARAHAAHVEVARASIECGGTHFSAVTRLLYYSGISQTITALLPGAAVARTVDLREPSFVTHRDKPAIRVAAFYVESWQCRPTPAGQVLVLWYNCADNYPDAPEQACASRNEWQRYISVKGEMLDQGFSLDDPRYVALRSTLGYRDGPPDLQDGEASFAVIAARPEIFRKTMRCGGTRFSAETLTLDLARISQTIMAPTGTRARHGGSEGAQLRPASQHARAADGGSGRDRLAMPEDADRACPGTLIQRCRAFCRLAAERVLQPR